MALPGSSVYYTDMRLALWVLIFLSLVQQSSFHNPTLTRCLLAVAILVLVGTLTLISLARHAIKTVFNRGHFNSLPFHHQAAAFWKFLFLLNPLQVVWRFCTAPLRTLPDVYIVGEVRCGTTTLAAHLQNLQGANGPFCPWIHPLGDKESFYFVGHYWGLCHPYWYRMCFPLVTTKWFHKYVLRKPFFCYDACAQYLTAPWVPRLIKQATPHAGFVVCVRDPVLQNVSWWRYENMATSWGDSLGLGPTQRDDSSFQRNDSHRYPPRDFQDAWQLATSTRVEESYQLAAFLQGPFLPLWAISWPLGQLSALKRCGSYAVNLQRYLDCFGRKQFEIVDVEELRNTSASVMKRIAHLIPVPIERLQIWIDAASDHRIHKNEAAPLHESLEPDETCMRRVGAYYAEPNERLFQFIGRDLGWHQASHYVHDS